MLDYYSNFPTPSKEERVFNAMNNVKILKFSKLSVFKEYIEKSVLDIKPGSYTGYFVFGKEQIANKAFELLSNYKKKINKMLDFFMLIVKLKIICKKFKKRVCETYKPPDGIMYKYVLKNTLIGK